MFSTGTITDQIAENAKSICMPQSMNSLLELQLSYWLCVQRIMNDSGFEELRKRMPNISEPLAMSIKDASISELMKLCSGEVCTVQPSIDENLIEELILPNPSSAQAKVSSKMALQLISEQRAA